METGESQRGVTVNRGVFWQGGDPRWSATRSITPLTRTVRADVCIVGGGFTGLWSALSLKKLAGDLEVVLLEQTYCGHGPSGRNGGWLNAWDDILPTLIRQFGQDDALALLDLSHRSLSDMTQMVGEGAIDCDLMMEGGMIVAASEAQLRRCWGRRPPWKRRGEGILWGSSRPKRPGGCPACPRLSAATSSACRLGPARSPRSRAETPCGGRRGPGVRVLSDDEASPRGARGGRYARRIGHCRQGHPRVRVVARSRLGAASHLVHHPDPRDRDGAV